MSAMGDALDQFAEVETGEAFTVQNPQLLKVELSETSVMARNGAMVAYQGDVQLRAQGRRGRAAAQEGGDRRVAEADGGHGLGRALPRQPGDAGPRAARSTTTR